MITSLDQNWWEYSNLNSVPNLSFDISTADTALRNQQKIAALHYSTSVHLPCPVLY